MKTTDQAALLKLSAFRTTILAFVCAGLVSSSASDLRIALPKRGHLTPVQELNRDGVKDLEKGRVERAKQRFVKAYLLDPDDPFTLNNLGYVSELEGDGDRALRYYQLAASINTDAVIDEASSPGLKGQPVSEAFQGSNVTAFRSNKANVQAIILLGKGRVSEAESILKAAYRADPNNPFLLDCLGYVMESEGDLQSALQYYSSAASLHSKEQVLLTLRPKWRGRSISEVAAQSAKAVSETLAKGEDTNARVARLNLRGVFALNHNDATGARKDFVEAYNLDPQNAFTINNIGYIAELNGDRETAEMYYSQARSAVEANERVTYATHPEAEGRRVGALAADNQQDVESRLRAIQDTKRRTRTQPQLKQRDQSSAPQSQQALPSRFGVQPPPLPPLELPGRQEGSAEGTLSPSGHQPIEPAAPLPSVPPNNTSSPQHQPPDSPERR